MTHSCTWIIAVTMILVGCFRLAGADASITDAPEPPKPSRASPLTPEEELATFSLPPGFKAELVAAEPDGGKFVAITFDHAGRLWTMTALEYPLDANETPGEARELFSRGGRDRALVFDTPTARGPQKPRIFAEGLVIPLGILPFKNGAFIQYGGEIRFYRDTNGDGKSDNFVPVLTGFGIEDSHLFPHQFTRAPGGWILMAQGAFNYSNVKTQPGDVTEYNKTKLARFTPDGKRFEIVGWGPCNIWGLVIDRSGEIFIQEANDQGWPMMPFLEGASYPLCGDDVPRPYSPPFPKTGRREMGGTGLSGLAFSEGADSFPPPWRDVFFIANPITERIQAIRLHRGDRSDGEASGDGNFGNGWRLEHLPDFLLSGDPWFRPVAMAFGPDGCLYIIDWYNKIISHNEVPRNHPERDKTRGRIWRIRHESQPHRPQPPDLYTVSDAALLTHLQATNTWEVNAAWQELVDRQAVSLAPQLAKLATDENAPADVRIRSLWSLEGLNHTAIVPLDKLAASQHRSLRKEAIRVIRQGIGLPIALSPERLMQVVDRGLDDRDRIVRQEAIRLLGEMLSDAAVRAAVLPQQMVTELMRASVRLPGSSPAQWRNYFDAFERYLIHKSLEKHSTEVSVWLASYKDSENDLQSRRAFAALVLGGADGASRLAEILTLLGRSPTAEELLLVASVSKEPGATTVLKTELLNPTNLQLLYDNRSRLAENSAALAPLLTEALQELVARDGSDVNQALLVKLSAGFRLTGLENQLIAAASRDGASAEQQTAALRALRESGSSRVDVFRGFAGSSNGSIQREAVAALAAAKSEDAVAALLEVWPLLPPSLRKMAVDRLASSKSSAGQLVTAVGSGSIARDELDGYTLDKLLVVLPDDPAVKKLAAELGSTLEPVLRLNAGDGDFVETDLALSGPFTVEAWVKLDPGIGNSDSMLAGQGALDANFHDNHFRVWIGGGTGDIVIAKKPMVAEAWTHIAFTRDAEGRFRIYLNGELENTSERTDTRRLEHLNVGASNPSGGTAGEFSEFRIWNVCQSADRIRATANVALGSIPGTSNHDRRLVYHSQAGSWGKLRGNARIERTADLPPIQSQAEIAAQELKFSEMRVLANRDGNDAHGEELFITTCAVCHTVKGRGGKIGPVLDGAGASGVEALLRNLLSPNAAMEAGYRRFRVETKDGEIQEGLLVSQDEKFVVIRQPNTEDLRIPRVQIKRAGFSRLSVMPEGLIEGLRPQDVSDLFAYLKALK